MQRSASLMLCLLLVLAGCGAFGGSGDQTTETTSETTGIEATATETAGSGATTAETTASATTDDEQNRTDLPPGLSASQVTDAAALAAAHEDALAGQSYTYDRETRVVAANGTELGRWTQRVQVGTDRLQFNHTQTGEGTSISGLPIDDSRVYTNGSVTFWKAAQFSDGYRRRDGRGFAENTFSSEQLLADVLNASETSVEPVEQGGATWYRVRAAGENQTLTYDVPNSTVAVDASNVTATALVAPSGFVRSVTYEFDFVRDGTAGHRTMTIRYSAVGETDVGVPAWVADAKATTNATEG